VAGAVGPGADGFETPKRPAALPLADAEPPAAVAPPKPRLPDGKVLVEEEGIFGAAITVEVDVTPPNKLLALGVEIVGGA